MSLAPSYVMGLLHVSNLALAGGVVFLMIASASITQPLTRATPPTVATPVALVLIVMAAGGILLAVPTHALWKVFLVSESIGGIIEKIVGEWNHCPFWEPFCSTRGSPRINSGGSSRAVV